MHKSTTHPWFARIFAKSEVLFLCAFSAVCFPEDPCIEVLGTVNPGAAATLSAQKDQAQRQAEDKFHQGLGTEQIYQGDTVKQNDAQYTAREAASGDQIGGDYTSRSAPVFAQGAAMAMLPQQKQILALCAQRRGAQGAAQQKTAEENRRVADLATQEDKQDGAGFGVKVIYAGDSGPGAPPPPAAGGQ